MGRRGSAVQAFCRRQNLADGGIYFRRLNKKEKGPPWDLSHGEQEAVELGLIDEIGGLSDALTCLHKMIERRNREKPAGLRDDPAL